MENSDSQLPDFTLSDEQIPLYEPVVLDDSHKEALKSEIKELLKERKAALVAHYYVDQDVQDLADATGGCVSDSLEMARFGRRQIYG